MNNEIDIIHTQTEFFSGKFDLNSDKITTIHDIYFEMWYNNEQEGEKHKLEFKITILDFKKHLLHFDQFDVMLIPNEILREMKIEASRIFNENPVQILINYKDEYSILNQQMFKIFSTL